MRRSRLSPQKPQPAPSQPPAVTAEKVLRRAKTRDAPSAPTTPGELRQAEAVKFQMVLEPDVATKIDELREKPVRMSRRHWIRLAIAEKIERDR